MVFEKPKVQILNTKNRRSDEKSNGINKTYKITVMRHGRHIYAKSYDMSKATMCVYPQSDYALPHWRSVLRCCDNFPCINITEQETDNQY